MWHHLRLQEELLTTVALTNLDHDRVLHLRRQSDLKRELVHAVESLPAFERSHRVLDIKDCLS